MDPLITVKRLCKTYATGLFGARTGVTALADVSFQISRGSVFGVVGESGCGKTTLARIIIGLEARSDGSILYQGTDIRTYTGKKRRELNHRMQIVFQDPDAALDPKLTVRTSLSEGLSNRRIPRKEREERISSLVERVGIPAEHLARYPHEFSGGQRQRLVIARALSMEPDFLVLDEPVSNLDVSIQAQIINLLVDLKDEFDLTFLFISHDLNLVGYIADTISVMFQGRIVESGNAAELTADPLHPYTKMLLASVPSVRGQRKFGDQQALTKSDTESVGCPFYSRCPERVDRCAREPQVLAEIRSGRHVACGILV